MGEMAGYVEFIVTYILANDLAEAETRMEQIMDLQIV
jgi:hypothetical protein